MKSKYASISLNTEISPYCAKVDWHTGEPTYFQILESKNVSEIEKLFEDWISTRISHRHSFKIESFDIDNISFLPFVIPQNHGKIKMDNDDKITQIVQEWLEKDIFASKNILNTVSLSQFDISLQQKFSTPEYYAMHQTDSGVAELHNLPLDWVERGYHQFGGWIGATQRIWVEVDLIGHSFHGAKPYEPSEEAKKLGINEVFVVKSQIEKNSNHARLYEKVGNRFEYVLTYQSDDEPIPVKAYPLHGMIAANISANSTFDNSLQISLLNSAKQIIDQYDTKIPASHLKNPKTEGCLFWVKDKGIYIRIEKDNIIGTICGNDSKGFGIASGFKIPIMEVIDKSGYITERTLRNYFDKIKKMLLNSSEDEILDYFGIHVPSSGLLNRLLEEDEETDLENMKSKYTAQGKTLANILLATEVGYLTPTEIEDQHHEMLVCVENEDTTQAIFYALKALLLLRMPAVKEQIKKDTKLARKDRKYQSIIRQSKRRFWGSDKITYLYPETSGVSKGRKYHFVRGFIRKNSNGTLSDVRPHYRGDLGLGVSNTVLTFGNGGGGGYSQAAIDWIKSVEKSEGISIRHAESGGEYHIPLSEGKYYKLDGYCHETNTIYEFHGDCWHGNLNVYSPEDCPHPYRPEATAQQLYDETKQREEALKALGYNLVVMWESDWLQLK